MLTVQVDVRIVYGNELIYPHNEAAHRFAKIARTKTLSLENLKDLAAVGCRIELVGAPVQHTGQAILDLARTVDSTAHEIHETLQALR